MRRFIALEYRAIFCMHAAAFAHRLQLSSGRGNAEAGQQIIQYHARQLIVVNELELTRSGGRLSGRKQAGQHHTRISIMVARS
ncbi:hypothetical protein D3C81_2163660 [compost metagenome]